MGIFVFLFGLVFGSFANVLIDRGDDISVLTDRSHCDFCKKNLSWFELIPIFSFVFQRGRCNTCKKKLSIQYPLVELVMGLAFLLVYSLFALQSDFSLVFYLLLTFAFVVLFIADLKYYILPDSMIVLSLFCIIAIYFLSPVNPLPYLISAIGAGGFFFCLWLITKGRGMGFGDVKLACVMGLLLGYPKIIVALYIAFLTGALYGVILILGKKKTLKSAVAFGPFLLFGLALSVYFGDRIIQLWQTFH
ncbi:MAG: prepilin peptidase [Patescibacteria group bacterium]